MAKNIGEASSRNRRFQTEQGLVAHKATANFELKSLILAQIERWRHA
jgi:hypothetical protein